MKPNLNKVFSQWRREFFREARADNYSEIRRHIEYLGLDCTPVALVEGTELLLTVVVAYHQLDGQKYSTLVRQQRYRLGGDGLPKYCLTFNFGLGHYGRILTDHIIGDLDFADLFEFPWYEYNTAGFHEVWISRLDGKSIGKREYGTLYNLVRDDMYYDYSKKEVAVSVDMTEFADTVRVTAVSHISR